MNQRFTWHPTKGWIKVRKLVQYFALLIFLLLFVVAQDRDAPGNFVNLFVRLDPLLTISHLFASRTFLIASTVSIITFILTIVFGRVWCGWICPLGTVLDLFSLRRWRKKPEMPLSDSWRSVKYFLLLTILAAALFGNLTLLILDPITIMLRTFSTSVWPALDQVITAAEGILYQIPLLAKPIAAIDMLVRPTLLPSTPVYYRNAVFFLFFFLGVIALNLIKPRFWCRYLCPLGGLLGLLSKFALVKREVGDECKGCTLCANACPTGTIDPAENYASDPGECTMCLDCAPACPRQGVGFQAGVPKVQWNAYDPGRREFLAAIGTAVAGTALIKISPSSNSPSSHLLRPPGVDESDFMDACIRCAECVRACPTGGRCLGRYRTGFLLWTRYL